MEVRGAREETERAVAMTRAPEARAASTMERPRPREEPVTNQTWDILRWGFSRGWCEVMVGFVIVVVIVVMRLVVLTMG